MNGEAEKYIYLYVQPFLTYEGEENGSKNVYENVMGLEEMEYS